MVKRTRFSVRIVSKQLILTISYDPFIFISLYNIIYINNIKLRKVYWYSTAATDEAAYIIGGYQGNSRYSQTISEFKNEWRKLGDLSRGRDHHGSISIGHQTMVVGGNISSG